MSLHISDPQLLSVGVDQLSASRLTIRLDALSRNFMTICGHVGSNVAVGAAVKADGYGLGAVPVCSTLAAAGCSDFFVAHLSEALEILETVGEDSSIYVFNGAMPGTAETLAAKGFIPLIISLDQLALWRRTAVALGRRLPTGLHFDTGMGRTGFTSMEAKYLLEHLELLDGLDVVHVMSHMASADDLESTQPQDQLSEFLKLRSNFPTVQSSLANSAGVFRGQDFHFDLVRPGIALYGGAPLAGQPNPMEHTVVLEAPILQIKQVEPGELVGYGATYEVGRPSTHVTLTVGYADGYLRSESNSGAVWIGGTVCPIVGRVSMDLTIVDATQVGSEFLYPGAPVEMIGPNRPVDEVAADAGTIANELLTELGSRYETVYSPVDSAIT